MYETYWKLTKRPFDNSLVSENYYPSELHQAALLKLRYAIENRSAVTLLSGVSGVGKTMLLNRLTEQMPDFVGPFIRLNYTCMNSSEMLRYIAAAVAPEGTSYDETDNADSLLKLERFLMQCSTQGKHPVLLIDEAHTLNPTEHLESLRQMMNLAASRSKGEAAWTIVLSGMPSLIANVHRNGAFRDRVAAQCVLTQLNSHDCSAYIAHRLRAAGCEHTSIFSNESLDLIHHATHGLPRKINSLCDLALMVGYAQDVGTIDASLVESIYIEMNPTAFVGELTV
jgi:general secretion pathway protein A